MTNHLIANDADEQFGRTITWQYDKAENLISFLQSLKSFYDNSTKYLWDKYAEELNVDNATDYGLALLGSLIGCIRPDGISTELFRKFIKAKFKIAMSNYSIADINEYLHTIFGDAAHIVDYGSVADSDSSYNPMTIHFVVDGTLDTELQELVNSNPSFCFVYPAAVYDGTKMEHIIFGFEGQEPAVSTDPITGGLDESNFCADFDDTIYIPEEERITA